MYVLRKEDLELGTEVAKEQYPKHAHMEKLHFAKGFAHCLYMIRQKFLVVDFEKKENGNSEGTIE